MAETFLNFFNARVYLKADGDMPWELILLLSWTLQDRTRALFYTAEGRKPLTGNIVLNLWPVPYNPQL